MTLACKITLLLILSFNIAAETFCAESVISGNLKSSPLGKPVANIAVVAKTRGPYGGLLASGVTDSTGSYRLVFQVDPNAVRNPAANPAGYALSSNYPNPFNPSTRFTFQIPREGTFTIRVVTATGQIVYRRTLQLAAGIHTFDAMNFGASGVYFIEVAGNDFHQTLQALNLGSGSGVMTVQEIPGGRMPVQVEKRSSRLSRSALVIPDSIDLRFSKAGYKERSIRISYAAAMTHNDTIEKIPMVVDFQAQMFTIRGERIKGLQVKFETSDSTRFFTSDADGVLRVHWPDYKEQPDTTAQISHSDTTHVVPDQYGMADHDDGTYMKWMIGTTTDSVHYGQKNLFQNAEESQQPVSSSATVPLNTVSKLGRIEIYLVHQWVIHPFYAGWLLSMDSDVARSMIDRRLPGVTTKWVPVLSAYAVDIVQFDWNVTTGQQVSKENLTRAISATQLVLDGMVMPNGKVLMKYNPIITISSLDDPRWKTISDRDFENVAWTQFENTTPGNSTQVRESDISLKYAEAAYGQSESFQNEVEEQFEKLTNMDDPVGFGGSSGHRLV